MLKQDTPETFEVDPKVETELLIEHEQETEPQQVRHSERLCQPPVKDEYATKVFSKWQ